MDAPKRLSEVRQAGMTLWCFCLQCGHASLFDPVHLAMRLKVKVDLLDDVARRMKCTRCTGRDGKLMPTRRGMVSFHKPDRK
jgi:hypothetical protein